MVTISRAASATGLMKRSTPKVLGLITFLGAEGELASTAAGEGGDGDAGPAESLEGAEPTESLDGDEAVDGEGAPSDGEEEAAAAEVAGAETTVESQPDPDVKVE